MKQPQDRGGAPSPAPRTSPAVGYERIREATTPDKSSAVVAKELGITPGAVRAVWQRLGLPKRPAGKRPLQCASSRQGPPHDPTA